MLKRDELNHTRATILFLSLLIFFSRSFSSQRQLRNEIVVAIAILSKCFCIETRLDANIWLWMTTMMMKLQEAHAS